MAKQALIILVVVIVFGVLVPWYRGWLFLDSATIVVYACISLLFVAPAAAEMFGAPETRPLSGEILSKIVSILAYGWGISVLILVSAIVTMNVARWQGRMLIPPLTMVGSALLLSLTASTATIAGTALLATHLGRGKTKTILRVIFLLLLLAWWFNGDQHMTATRIERLNLIASAVCALAAIILLRLLLRTSASSAEAPR